MKLGMHSCGLKSYATTEAIRKAGEFGYDGLEIDVFPLAGDRSSWDGYRNELTRSLPEISGAQRSAGIDIASLCLGVLWYVNISGGDEGEREFGVSIINDCIEIASRLGADCLLLPVGQPEEVTPAKARDNLYDSIMRCVKNAEKHNIVLGVENVVQRVLWNSGDLIEFVDRVGSPWCGAYYDIGNPYFVNIAPADEIIQLGKRIVRFHIKDMRDVGVPPVEAAGNEKGAIDKAAVKFRGDRENWRGKRAATIGTGIVDWPALTAAIRKIDFDGYLVTEIQQDGERPDTVARDNVAPLRALGEKIRKTGA